VAGLGSRWARAPSARCCSWTIAGSPGSLAQHAVQDLTQAGLLALGAVCDVHARDRVAVQHPVPHLLPRAERWPLGGPLDADVLQSRLGQPPAQDIRVGHLEFERRRIVGEAGNPEATAVSAALKNWTNSSSAGEP
jgi:hypothetical protein